METLIEWAMWIGLVVVAVLAMFIFLTTLYRRASKEIAFVRTGVGGEVLCEIS